MRGRPPGASREVSEVNAPAWHETLRTAEEPERRAACRAALEDPSAVLFLDALVGALADDAARVRRAAGDTLAALGQRHAEVDPLLREALRGDDPLARFEAARILAELAPPAPRLIPALVEALDSPSQETAWEAARLLAATGRLHAEVLPIVTGLVHAGETPSVRRMALFCLRDLAPERPETHEALLAASRSEDPSLRRAAITTLPSLASGAPGGNGARAAIAARLEEAAARDPDPAVRALAARAAGLALGPA